jgi:hypothetical protein
MGSVSGLLARLAGHLVREPAKIQRVGGIPARSFLSLSACQAFGTVIAELASRTDVRTFSTEGLKRSPFLATT